MNLFSSPGLEELAAINASFVASVCMRTTRINTAPLSYNNIRLCWCVRFSHSERRFHKSSWQMSESIDSCTGTRYNQFMIRSFRHRGLRRLYERDDPSRIAADQLNRITLALADLDAAGKPSDLDLPGYRLHPLRGDLRGMWSISITGNWRITFRFEDGDVYDVDLVDYH